MNSPWRYFHTVRHLRAVQLFGRLRYKASRPTIDLAAPLPMRALQGAWMPSPHRNPMMREPGRIRLLNEERRISDDTWESSDISKLWRYHLHYFDDLVAADAHQRVAWHRALMRDWIRMNPPGVGTGWEPYPTSRRIVNWVKWALNGEPLESGSNFSLTLQARWLRQRIEHHLGGNHVIANAKALVFAGAFFAGGEADDWRNKGIELIGQELREQILDDGGHYERSPMYHALVLEDILDLINLANVYGESTLPGTCRAQWRTMAGRMMRWLPVVLHPDNEVSFFNDSAVGVAPPPPALLAYGAALLGETPPAIAQFHHLDPSGYVRAQNQSAVLIADVGALGPDHLPAHGHADTLSFELSLGGERVIVNSGVSQYEPGPQRDYERGTASHNTVQIDGRNSSDVWGSFRVGRRAYPRNFRYARTTEGGIGFEAEHDGFSHLSGCPTHRRRWELRADSLVIDDSVLGTGYHRIDIFFHFAPRLAVARGCAEHEFEIRDEREVLRLRISVAPAFEWSVMPSAWHPEFGSSVTNLRLAGRYDGPLPCRLRTILQWRE